MTFLLRTGVIGIALLLYIVPLAAWAQTPTCSSVTDHGKRNTANNTTCYCPNAVTTCEWRGAGSPTPQVGGTTQVTDPGALINNQLINNPSTGESAPVTAGEFNRRPPQRFMPLAGIPGITTITGTTGTVTMPQLLNALYRMLIVIGALIAFLKITVAGLKYMGSDNFGSKASAKEDITASLLGLLILLATVLIINTVLGSVNLNALQGPSINFVQQAPPPLLPGGGGSGPTPSVVARAGCNQLSANNVTCPSGQTGTISGSTIACAAPTSVATLPRQSTFKPITEAQCTGTQSSPTADAGNVGHLIRGGKTVFGIHEVRTRDTQPTVESLAAACTTSGGSRVVKTFTPYVTTVGTAAAVVHGYVCTN